MIRTSLLVSRSYLKKRPPSIRPFPYQVPKRTIHSDRYYKVAYPTALLGIAGFCSGAVYAIVSGDLSEKLKKLQPAPCRKGFLQNINPLKGDHVGSIRAKLLLKDVLQNNKIAILDGAGGIGKFSTARNVGQDIIANSKNASFFSIDCKNPQHFRQSLISVATILGISSPSHQSDLNLIKSINIELDRRGPSFIIYKCVRSWLINQQDLFLQQTPLQHWFTGQKSNIVITTGDKNVIQWANNKKLSVIQCNQLATVEDLHQMITNELKEPAILLKLKREFYEGWGIGLLNTIVNNPRLTVQVGACIINKHQDLNKNNNNIILSLTNKIRCNPEKEIIQFLLEDTDESVRHLLHIICQLSMESCEVSFSKVFKLFLTLNHLDNPDTNTLHNIEIKLRKAVGELVNRCLIKYDPEHDILYRRLLNSQVNYILNANELKQHQHINYSLFQSNLLHFPIKDFSFYKLSQ
ncbi:hypothetical protein DID75_01045 [Candidatus Marinamargulisbacteria bacterium SCGC AG-410-N11]|nr:hypothetical protein DID75_01045 [Candidatus Marinamargulisbacteria bacterium SCGC AG-410-N11]